MQCNLIALPFITQCNLHLQVSRHMGNYYYYCYYFFFCMQGTYGMNCGRSCSCLNGGTCDSVTGVCHCPPGIHGENCQDGCPEGDCFNIFPDSIRANQDESSLG